MAPMTWTTTEQADFLMSWRPKYVECAEAKAFHGFWSALFIAWFEKWPERSTLFPGIDGALDATQNEALAVAISGRKKASHLNQLRTWFRWRENSSRRTRVQQKQSTALEKLVWQKGSSSRIRTPAELYMLEHYDDRIKPQLQAEQDAGKIPSGSSKEFLSASRKFSQNLLDAEDDDVKARIQQMYELQEKKIKNDAQQEEETDPITIQAAIDELPYLLARISEIVKQRTRFAISFICAGPDPSRNWDITSIFCHPDETPDGKMFTSLYADAEKTMLTAFQGYAERLFPPEQRDPNKCSDHKDSSPSSTECESGEQEMRERDKVEVEVEDGRGDEIAVADEGDNVDVEVTLVESIGRDELQVSDDASRSLVDDDASFGTLDPSGLANTAPSCADQSGLSLNASAGLGSMGSHNPFGGGAEMTSSCATQSVLSLDASTQSSEASGSLGSENPFDGNFGSTGGIQIPPTVPMQSLSAFIPPCGYVAGSFIPSQPTFSYGDGLSFSDAMNDVGTTFSGDQWNFSGIDFSCLGAPTLSNLRSTQFNNGYTVVSDPVLPPLSPVKENLSPGRPRLPPVPPPSQPDEQPNGAHVEPATTTKSKPKARPKHSVAAPELQTVATDVPVASKASKSKRPEKAMKRSASTTNPSESAAAPQQSHPDPVGTTGTAGPCHSASPDQPPVVRTSKRIPIQSKQNEALNAIGTNQATFINHDNSLPEPLPGQRKEKRAAEDVDGMPKKKKNKKH